MSDTSTACSNAFNRKGKETSELAPRHCGSLAENERRCHLLPMHPVCINEGMQYTSASEWPVTLWVLCDPYASQHDMIAFAELMDIKSKTIRMSQGRQDVPLLHAKKSSA